MYVPYKFSIVIGLVALSLIPLLAFGRGGIENSKMVETQRQVSAFTRIASNGSVETRIHKSPEFRVVVATDTRQQDLFEVKTTNGLLSLGFKSGSIVRHTAKVIVDVYMPELESLSVSGSGKAVLMDRFDGKDLRLAVSGSGSIQGTIHYDSLAASISGSGSMKLSGACPQLGITLSGSGSFDGRQLPAVSVSAVLSGSGSINLDVGSSLAAVVSGSGRIRYHGNPTVNSKVAGTGSVRKAGS
jgi:hypothetical protein